MNQSVIIILLFVCVTSASIVNIIQNKKIDKLSERIEQLESKNHNQCVSDLTNQRTIL